MSTIVSFGDQVFGLHLVDVDLDLFSLDLDRSKNRREVMMEPFKQVKFVLVPAISFISKAPVVLQLMWALPRFCHFILSTGEVCLY